MSDDVVQAERVDDLSAIALGPEDAQELLRHVAELTRSQLDLPTGLRAAAEGCPRPRLAEALRKVAEQLETGLPVETVLSPARLRLPSSLAALVAATMRSGDSGQVLGDLLDLKETLGDVRREVRSAVAYPLLMLAATGATVLLLLNAVVPSMAEFFKEFELQLSAQTEGLLWLSQSGQWLFLGWLAVFGVTAMIARWFFPWPVWCRLRASLPAVGPIFQWSAAAEFARLLAALVEHQLPLDAALRLAADSASDGDLAAAGKRVSAAVAQGTPIDLAIEQESASLPLMFVPYVRLGQRSGRLASTLKAVSESLLERVRTRALLIRVLAPPLIFLLIAAVAIALPVSLLLPLMQLIQGLSGGGPGRGGGAPLGQSWVEMTPRVPQLMVLLFPLFALMLGRRLMFRSQRGAGRSTVESLLYLLEWRLLVVVFIALLGGFSWGPLVPLVIIALFVLVVSYFRYLRLEKQSLIFNLMVAADSGVPLADVAAACAEEFKGWLQRRTLRLAELLRLGHPLSLALSSAGISLPLEVRFAITAAESSGALPSSLRQSLRVEDVAQRDNAAVTARLSYLTWMLLVMLGIVTFLMLKIVPVWAKMFQEFNLELPPLTVLLLTVAQFMIQKWPLIIMLATPLALAILLLDVYVFRLATFLLPPLHLLQMRWHGAVVLRGLSAMIGQQRPLAEALRHAAWSYPAGIVAGRIESVYKEFEQGRSWQEAMRKRGFLSSYDAALLQAAERAGNLTWALNEAADGLQRRLNLRTRWLVNLLLPVVLLGIGAMVFFVVVGLFMPLIELIQGMSL